MNSPLKQISFAVLVLAQLGVLAWMVFDRNQLVSRGEKILLECEPIDPRSLLSGDYVILNYRISRFGPGEVEQLLRGEKSFRKSRPVWVVLEKAEDSDFHEATAITGDPGLLEDGETFLRGKVASFNGSHLRIRYGLEQYFVPQNQGKAIEREMNKASVEVAVNPGGDGAVTRIFIEGEEVKFH